MLVPKYYDMLY